MCAVFFGFKFLKTRFRNFSWLQNPCLPGSSQAWLTRRWQLRFPQEEFVKKISIFFYNVLKSKNSHLTGFSFTKVSCRAFEKSSFKPETALRIFLNCPWGPWTPVVLFHNNTTTPPWAANAADPWMDQKGCQNIISILFLIELMRFIMLMRLLHLMRGLEFEMLWLLYLM